MRIRSTLAALLLAAISLPYSGSASAQVPPPPPVPPTLWSFLGIPQAYYKLRGATTNRRGNHPGLEATPPLKGIADPANLESPFEPIKVAAEVKQAEDAAPQKIKGIKYLAEIGCGCYNQEGNKVTKAMLAGLNDCTESVRKATVEAIAEAAEDEMCAKCGQRSCCSEELTLELAKLAYERDDHGCYKEPSADVREAATAALNICCPNAIPVTVIEEDGREKQRTREAGEPTPAEADDPTPGLPDKPDPNAGDANNTTTSVDPSDPTSWTSRRLQDSDDTTTSADPTVDSQIRTPGTNQPELTSSRRTWNGEQPETVLGSFIRTDAGQQTTPITHQAAASTRASGELAPVASDASPPTTKRPTANSIANPADLRRIRGVVERVDVANGFVTIQIDKDAEVPVGAKINVFHRYLLGEQLVAMIEVVHSSKSSISARSIDRGPLTNVSRGDQIRVR